MKPDRKVLEKEILYFIDMFRPGSDNVKIYQEIFDRMSDKQFFEWMERLHEGEILALYAPNLDEPTLSIERNYEIADKLEYELFQHITLTDQHTGQTYVTPNKHLVGLIPVRRQVQMLVKKSSIPESNSVVDERSGQATGDSKGARMSNPEIQVNASKGLRNMVVELIKFRGGDEAAYNSMTRSIVETGEVSMDAIMAENSTTVQSNVTLSVFLKCMQLGNNL